MTHNTETPQTPNQGGAAPQPTHDDLRAEYQAAQDSAQHHANLIWSVTSIMWGTSLVLMGFILGALKEPALRPLITVLSVLGIVLIVFLWIFALQYNAAMRHKYARCKEIESTLHLRQHSTLRWKSGSQRILYGVVMVVLLTAWVAVLWTAWCRCAG
jgi:hypothetical protein